MNDDDKALVERAIKAAEPFKVAHIAMDVLNLKRLLSTELHEEARHDLRLIASMGQQWQPIETAPKDRYILIAGDSGYIGTPLRVEVCRFHPDYIDHQWRNYANDSFRDSGGPPTHWMPLPAAPGKGEI